MSLQPVWTQCYLSMWSVKERLRQCNAPPTNPDQGVSSVPRENAFAREGSRENPLDYVETLMNVHLELLMNLPVVSMLSAKIFLEVLIVSVLPGTMVTLL